MRNIYTVIMLLVMEFINEPVIAQSLRNGKVMDAVTKEPVHGASVNCCDCKMACATDSEGSFKMSCCDCNTFLISSVGYESQKIVISHLNHIVSLVPSSSLLNEVVVSANRETVKRTQAPVAISSVNTRMLQDAKAISADQVLNKVSGVYMVNLGNEQHQMSIRQPMTTKSLFLYLEDGIPVRTTGIFNHNALLEMNMAAVKTIEVIKGPSSSLYGSEAIGGVVNFITISPTVYPTAKLSVQGNNIGYKRVEWQTSGIIRKWGLMLSGYYARRHNSFMEYSDFNKAAITAKAEYSFSDKSKITNSISFVDYYSDMPGTIDSTMFAERSFQNPQTFTYRKVQAFRFRSTFTQEWKNKGKTSVSAVYRRNRIEQNPAYAIKEDYRITNGIPRGNKNVAHGEINASSFSSYGIILQHRQKLKWKQGLFIGGTSIDISPSAYNSEYLSIKKDTNRTKYTGYRATDSVLTGYKNVIANYAAYVHVEFTPVKRVRVVSSLRIDKFRYNFNNDLKPSAYSGSPDATSNFQALSPKIGFTYSFSSKSGFYSNYSQGFVPPQVTEMYRGVKVPSLRAARFSNYEVGGWIEFIKDKLSSDLSAYILKGVNEVISVRLDDGSVENQNAGETMHKGVEAGLNANLVKGLSMRVSASYSLHRFTNFIEKGNNYNGHEMNAAPRWMHNAEIWYKPAFASGLRIGIESQKIGNYYLDAANTAKYDGYNVFHFRCGYQFRSLEVWMNVMNITNHYYAYIAGKTTSGYSYTPGEPRHLNLGVSYDFKNLRNK